MADLWTQPNNSSASSWNQNTGSGASWNDRTKLGKLKYNDYTYNDPQNDYNFRIGGEVESEDLWKLAGPENPAK